MASGDPTSAQSHESREELASHSRKMADESKARVQEKSMLQVLRRAGDFPADNSSRERTYDATRPQFRVDASRLNIRDAPDTNSDVLFQLERNSVVVRISDPEVDFSRYPYGGNFFLVQDLESKKTGWAHQNYLVFTGESGFVFGQPFAKPEFDASNGRYASWVPGKVEADTLVQFVVRTSKEPLKVLRGSTVASTSDWQSDMEMGFSPNTTCVIDADRSLYLEHKDIRAVVIGNGVEIRLPSYDYESVDTTTESTDIHKALNKLFEEEWESDYAQFHAYTFSYPVTYRLTGIRYYTRENGIPSGELDSDAILVGHFDTPVVDLDPYYGDGRLRISIAVGGFGVVSCPTGFEPEPELLEINGRRIWGGRYSYGTSFLGFSAFDLDSSNPSEFLTYANAFEDY